jgi:hypothetical protein
MTYNLSNLSSEIIIQYMPSDKQLLAIPPDRSFCDSTPQLFLTQPLYKFLYQCPVNIWDTAIL